MGDVAARRLGERRGRTAKANNRRIAGPLVWAALTAVASLGVSACDGSPGGDGGVTADAGADGSVADSGATADGSPTLEAPAPPSLLPCPTGYREVTDDGPVPYCDPWPESGHRDDCGPAEAHFPGEPGCAAVGTACPADGFPADLPTDRQVIFVAPDGRRGDGTRASPYPGLAAAPIRTLPAGSVVALGVGAHVGSIYPTQDLEVVGACASGTTLEGSGATPDSIVARGVMVRVRNLRVTGPGHLSGIDAFEGGSLDLEGVVIEGTAAGIYIDATSSLTAEDLIIRDLVVEERWGVLVEGTANIRHAVIERAYNDAVQADGAGARVTLERVALRETAMIGGIWGAGITAARGARVDASEVVLEGNHYNGASSDGAGSELHLVDAVVRETHRTPDGYNGLGLAVRHGGSLTATRVLIDANDGTGVGTDTRGGTLSLTDLLIRGGRGSGGPGLPASQHGLLGRGIDINDGAHGEVTRVAVEDNAEGGVVVAGIGAELLAHDLTIRSTRPRADGTAGRGLNVQDGGRADVTRALLEGNHEVSVFVAATGSTLTLRETAVARTLAGVPGGPGRGVNSQQGAILTLTRVTLRDSVGLGAGAFYGGVVTGVDVEVSGTEARACPATGCPNGPGGSSLVSTVGSELSLARFVLDGGALCGVQVANSADVALTEGVVARHAIGACIQVDGFDISRLSDSVMYVDNGTNLDSTTLPVPDVIAP